jgi:hypothetical protein
MAQKLEKKLYQFEKEMLKKLSKIPPQMPGERGVTTILTQRLLISCANKLADKYVKYLGNDAQLRSYLRRALYLKLYPLTECHMSAQELVRLNIFSGDIYKRLKDGVKKIRACAARDEALELLEKAIAYQVKNVFNYPK